MKENLAKPDFILLGAAVSILVLGILILSSASAFWRNRVIMTVIIF